MAAIILDLLLAGVLLALRLALKALLALAWRAIARATKALA